MKINITNDRIMTFAVFWAIIASGSQFFMNQNMILTDMVMLFLSALILIKNRKITKRNIEIFIVAVGYLLINAAVNIDYGVYLNDVVIVCTKLLFVAIIASNISLGEFVYKYVKIMLGLAVLSLLCFFYVQITQGGPLPFQTEYVNSNGATVYSTFYHTVGWKPVNGIHYYTSGYGYFTRNAGLFWEPGAYQIYLNLALMMYIAKPTLFEHDKRRKWYIPILVGTVISTLSTTAIICLICNLIFYFFCRGKLRGTLKKMFVIAGAVAAILLVEKYFGVVGEKLIHHGASFVDRMNDTSSGMELLLERPVVGYGIFAKEYLVNLLYQHGVSNISNGMIAFALNAGMVGFGLYFIRVFRSLDKMCGKHMILTCIALTEFVLMGCSESIMLAPIWLLFVFSFNERGAAKYASAMVC